MNYYKFTDGERTYFRASERLYRSGIVDKYGIGFRGKFLDGSYPVTSITEAEYYALVMIKTARAGGRRVSPQDSWIWNKDLMPASKPEVLMADLEAPTTVNEAPQLTAVPATHPNREAWLVALVEALRPTFIHHGAPLPAKLRVSCSFPSRGGIKQAGKATTIGQCWYPQNSADGTTEIFVSPTIADRMSVAEILVHELVHAALGPGHGHGKVFKRLALLVGLEGPMTATQAGTRLRTQLVPILLALGDYPHASLSAETAEKKQSTRLLKAECPECGYTVRVTRKWWVDVGAPHCPLHGEMAMS